MISSPIAGRRSPWGLVLLLVVAMVISFFDRGNLAVAAPILAPELGLSPWALGLLLSAFFWTYAAGQVGAGWLVDRIEVRWVYAAGFLLWSAATLSTAFVGSFAGLLAMRLLLGVGEAVTYPATSRILAAVIPERRRGLANSLVDLGARLGPALGVMCGALVVGKLGWRGLFLITGGAGLIWLIPWLARAPRTLEAAQPAEGSAALGWKQLLSRRAVWGTCGGLLADRWISRGASPVKVRRGFLVTGLLLTSALLPSVLLPRIEFAITGLFASCFTLGIYASNVFSLTQTLAGPEAAGRWTGLQNACGNLAGIAGPIATGWIITKTGAYSVAFIAASLACILGAASFGLLVRDSPVPQPLR